ncbi:hypothetical protein AURDEDRAFT_160826 [Auricularia subglabra TFB-10046 SS5]|nr:hypothetical protein AURDEDRAFT_160826 [Auricularia subglabra TFB-10046 SS5]
MPALGCMPEDVVRAFFDYLAFYDQLRFMSINRFCRKVGMAHPFYWRNLELDTDELSGVALKGAISLFLTRLDIAGQRSVNVTLQGADPLGPLQLIATGGHFSQIRFLTLSGVGVTRGQALLDILVEPAPVLEQLLLYFDGICSALAGAPVSCPVLSTGMFNSSAPSLRRLSLVNVMLPEHAPAALGALAEFSIFIRVGAIQHLPFILNREMLSFSVSDRISFAPEYYTNQAWANPVPASREDPAIPRLCAAIPAINAHADKFTELAVYLVDWDRSVNLLPCLPALTVLGIMLAGRVTFGGYSAVLECPKLEQLRFSPGGGVLLNSVHPGHVEAFADATIHGGSRPLNVTYQRRIVLQPPLETWNVVLW